MASPTIFIDVTTSLRWGKTTAVGIVRVERYLVRHLLDHYDGELGFAVFVPEAGCFRSASPDEVATLLDLLYGQSEAEEADAKPSKWRRLQTLRFNEVKQLSTDYFNARIRTRLERVGVPRVVTQASLATFSQAAAVASLGVKAVASAHKPRPPMHAPPAGNDRVLLQFEPFRDRKTSQSAVLLMAGLTWDYMSYDYLHQLRERTRLKTAHIIYDVIPIDFPQFVPNVAHLYHRHFVEIGQTGSVLFAISEYSADRYKKAILEENLIDKEVGHHGLPNFFSETEIDPKPIPQLTQRPFVVFCSTIEGRKNHMLLINAWIRLLERLPVDQVPQLVFIGKWGWNFESVKNHIEQDDRLRGRVSVLSNIQDSALVWLYQNAMFSVFPSFCEGWGLAASESLSYGAPVLISDAPALNEAAQDLMPRLDPMDVYAWVEKIEELITQPQALAALREKAAQFKPTPLDGFADSLISRIRAEMAA